MISQWIYKRKNGQKRKAGMLVAYDVNGRVQVGFSLCGPEDIFDKDLAFSIAASRALNKAKLELPSSIVGETQAFLQRCERYFKDATFPEIKHGDSYYKFIGTDEDGYSMHDWRCPVYLINYSEE